MSQSEMPAADELPIDPILAGEEHFRLVSGFADLFSAIVLGIGLSALAALLIAAVSGLGGLGVAAAAWGLAIPLVRQRRFAACAIVLAVAFASGLLMAAVMLAGSAGSLLVAGACWAMWHVYRIPIAAALAFVIPVTVLGGLSGVYDLIGVAGVGRSSPALAVLLGLVLFAAAMGWDLSDRKRRTRRSDVAFWLHLAAAPLVVHGTFALAGIKLGDGDQAQLGLVLALFGGLALVALLVDRRPILVSSLSYLIWAMATQVERSNALSGAAMIALVLGGGILLLAVGWNLLRRGLLALLPERLSGRLAQPQPIAQPVPEPAHSEAETEPLRLVFGFNDIFVSIGLIALVLGAVLLSATLADMPEARLRAGRPVIDLKWLLPPLLAIWGAAEFFVRRRRMALPAILLGIDFMLLSWVAAAAFVERVWLPAQGLGSLNDLALGHRSALPEAAYGVLQSAAWWAAAVVAAANLLFAWRQRVPVSVALALSGLIFPLLADASLLRQDPVWAQAHILLPEIKARLALLGVLVFGAALACDLSDRARQTLRADMAFWLHLLASALLLPVAFSTAPSWPMPELSAALLLYAGVLFAAILLDRRAPLLVGLPFLVEALNKVGLGGSAGLLAVCAVLTVCGLYWEKLRALLIERPAPAAT